MSTLSGGPLGLGPDRTFRYKAPSAIDTGMLLLCLACLVVTGAALVRSALVYGGLRHVPWQLWGLPAQFGVLLLAGVSGVVWRLVRHARAYVEVTRVGVVTHDWRGRERRLFWDEVNEVRHCAPGCSGVFTGSWPLELRADGRCLRISRFVEDGPELREIILACTGCTEATRTGGQVRYTRPMEE